MAFISIVTVCYQSSEYIRQCIESVLSQNFQDYEYVILDGGSSDGTVDIIQEYSGRLSYWHSMKDDGIADAFCQGIERTTGDWVMFLNSDDFLAGNYVLSNISQYLNKYSDADVVFGQVQRIVRKNEISPIGAPFGGPFSWEKFILHDTIPHPAAFTNREYFTRVGSFSKKYKIAMDYEHYLRAGPKLNARFVSVLVSYMRDGGLSRQDFMKVLKEWEFAHIDTAVVPVWKIKIIKTLLLFHHYYSSILRK